jgi:hypothetical protein
MMACTWSFGDASGAILAAALPQSSSATSRVANLVTVLILILQAAEEVQGKHLAMKQLMKSLINEAIATLYRHVIAMDWCLSSAVLTLLLEWTNRDEIGVYHSLQGQRFYRCWTCVSWQQHM